MKKKHINQIQAVKGKLYLLKYQSIIIKSAHNFLQNKSGNSVLKFIHNNHEYINSEEISKIFNDYFCEIAENVEAELIYSNVDPMTFIKVNGSHCTSLFLTPVTPIECTDISNLLKNSKQLIDRVPFLF